ncbi:MAG TPA: PilZ domain-containing protein [Spirochaetota bacterium]|nr:PilZ domain-containing protein [Spirochaetota bacterium]HPJ37162.1 PilZ domain-containing protein [Spirochaetota bacterium]HPQ51703.1 PilZ domain-containing protein [Spirochaetota bacterium]
MYNSINYNELSHDIKNEIDTYYSSLNSLTPSLTKEEAMTKWFNEKFDQWLIERYSSVKESSRKFFRFDIEIPVKVIDRIVETGTPESEEFDYIGTIVNISRGGFYFKSREPFNVSSIIKVNIDLSLIDKELSSLDALAMVLRKDIIENDTYGIGVMFSSVYKEDKENLDLFIFKNVAYYIASQ